MNIKVMRSVHLYLGCFFAPLLLLFLITGCWQTFDLHQASKGGSYKPVGIVKSFSQVHMSQRWTDQKMRPPASIPFRYLVLLMAIGLLVTTVLGIVMAFKYTKPWKVWASLVLGFLIPFFLLWMARGFAQEASPTDEIIVKATNAVIFQMKANLKLTDDQVNGVEPIIADNIIKTRGLQQQLEDGNIDNPTMYIQRQQLVTQEYQGLSSILTADQLKLWISIQNQSYHYSKTPQK